MKGLVYLSEAAIDFSIPDLKALTKIASTKNKLKNITGYLCFSNGRFLQYIEGSENSVNELFERIKEDARHKIIYEVESTGMERRIIPYWSMRHITTLELQKFNLERYIEQNLLYIKNNYSHKDRCRAFIWDHIRLISKIESQKS